MNMLFLILPRIKNSVVLLSHEPTIPKAQLLKTHEQFYITTLTHSLTQPSAQVYQPCVESSTFYWKNDDSKD